MASFGQQAPAGSWRGRGRGRNNFSTGNPRTKTPAIVPGKSNQRLTHFVSLPLGHHGTLRQHIAAFTDALISGDPPVSGLDKSIVVAPRRLHLTLGVMSLDSMPSSSSSTPTSKTLSAAISLLQSLKPRISEILGNEKLRVALNRMDIMKPDRGDLEKAHVLWVGPSLQDDDARRLSDVSEMIRKAFLDAGLMVNDRRPLKLHCTVINTVYRKPRSNQRQPFSFTSILASPAFQSIGGVSTSYNRPRVIDLGVWDVDEVQICEMGSYGPEGEYVSCGGCSLS